MTDIRLALMILNAFFAGVTVTIAVNRIVHYQTAKLALTLAAINFAAIAIALI